MVIKIKPNDIFKIAFFAYWGWNFANVVDHVAGTIVGTVLKCAKERQKTEEKEIKEEE